METHKGSGRDSVRRRERNRIGIGKRITEAQEEEILVEWKWKVQYTEEKQIATVMSDDRENDVKGI